jgi:AraC-like DNA-binding protein
MHHSSWSTRAHQVPERPAFWGEINRRYFGKLHVTSLDDGPLDASLEAYVVGALRMFRIEAPAHRVCRDASCGQLPADDFYKLVLVVRGRSIVEQAGHCVSLEPGQWLQYDPRVPYAITSPERSVLLVTQVPRQALGALVRPGLLHTERGTGNTAGLHAVFGTYLRSLSDQLPALPDGVGTAVCESVLGLLGSTLAEQSRRSHDPVPLPEVLKLRVRQYVQSHLSDPDLSIPRMAESLRCSTRYLHRVFEDEDSSLERLIWTLRLERSHAALAHEANVSRSVAEIGYAWGFKSSAHFSRLFRSHFGVTPGSVQRQAESERARSRVRQ